MCTMITERIGIEGSGRGRAGWIRLTEAHVSYDHPFDAPFEHTLNLDFVNGAEGMGGRVAVELTAAAARTLAATILAVLARAEAGGFVEAVALPDGGPTR